MSTGGIGDVVACIAIGFIAAFIALIFAQFFPSLIPKSAAKTRL